MSNKTLYFLGAGFSAGVKNSEGVRVPAQENLVEQIILHKIHFPEHFTRFNDFLTNVMGIPEMDHQKIPLEDIFTPIDKCIVDGISYRSLYAEQVREVRALIDYLIGKTLDIILRGNISKEYIDRFATYLVNKSSIRSNHKFSTNDPVSVISTNWDILLDNSIHAKLLTFYKPSEISTKGVVDYCCNISSYREGDEMVKAGLETLGRGGFNVKLIKLHGSLNWLQCPRCNRLYVDFDNKIAVNQFTLDIAHKERCRHCRTNFGDQTSHILVSNLVMPTFLKNLANTQYKLIWHNAALEIAEASKIVFIGYTLPSADYEIRQMLSRMVRPNAQIEVIDYGSSEDCSHISSLRNKYSTFFGRTIHVSSRGVEEFVSSIT